MYQTADQDVLEGERARKRASRIGMESEHVQQEVYQIVVKGHLDSEWSDWFDGLTITLMSSGKTILTGPLVDQTALHGVLIKIRDLGLPLLSLVRIQPEKECESNLFMHAEEEGSSG